MSRKDLVKNYHSVYRRQDGDDGKKQLISFFGACG